MIRALVFLFTLGFITTLKATVAPAISYTNWPTLWQEAYVRALVERILDTEIHSPAFVVTEHRASRPITISREDYWYPSHFLGWYLQGASGGDQISTKMMPYRALDNTRFNSIIAHELCHALLDHASYPFLPSAIEEGLCEAFALEVVRENLDARVIIETPSFSRARSASQIEHRTIDFNRFNPSLPLLEAVWQDDPTRSCAANGCTRYDELSWHFIQFIRTASRKTGLTKREVFRKIALVRNELADSLGEDRRRLRFEEFWTGLDQAFPGLTIDGRSPAVYFGTSTTFAPLSAGRHYGIQAISSWRKRSAFHSAPINPTLFLVSAVDVKSGDFYSTIKTPEPVPSSTVYAQLVDAYEKTLCLDPLNCEPTTQIEIQNGAGYGFILHHLDPGLYELRLLDKKERGTILKRGYLMQLHDTPPLYPETTGMFVWNIDGGGVVRKDPLSIDGCTALFTAPGLSQVSCPVSMASVEVRGQQFDLLHDWVRIIRPNGSRLWPVLSTAQKSVMIPAADPKGALEIFDLNPDTTDCRWEAFVLVDSGHMDQTWPTLSAYSGAGRTIIEISATPDPKYGEGERRSKVCVHARSGIRNNVCVDVVYNPR